MCIAIEWHSSSEWAVQGQTPQVKHLGGQLRIWDNIIVLDLISHFHFGVV